MLMPPRVASTMSLFASHTCTSISSSPASMLMARIPVVRTLPYSDRTVFFTVPFRVAKMRCLSSANSRTGTSDAMCSSGLIAMQLTTGLPRAARPAWGISCTLSQ